MPDLPVDLRGPVAVVLAAAADALPGPSALRGGARYEMKWDGFRCVAVHRAGRARLWSRQGKSLTEGFPDITAAVAAQVPPGTVLDGELVIWSGSRLDFDLLQRRMVTRARKATALAAQHPATYMVFDLLALSGTDLRGEPLRDRRAALEDLAARWRPPLQVSPVTDDPAVATEWASDYRPAGVEGLVAKAADGRYRPGRRDWVKVKTRETAEVIIGAVTGSLARPETVVLGRRRGADLVMVGRSVPLTPRQAAALADLLTPARGTHPWPDRIRANRFGSDEAMVSLVRVEPEVVAEVVTDAARSGSGFRHPVRFVRPRLDLTGEDVPTT